MGRVGQLAGAQGVGHGVPPAAQRVAAAFQAQLPGHGLGAQGRHQALEDRRVQRVVEIRDVARAQGVAAVVRGHAQARQGAAATPGQLLGAQVPVQDGQQMAHRRRDLGQGQAFARQTGVHLAAQGRVGLQPVLGVAQAAEAAFARRHQRQPGPGGQGEVARGGQGPGLLALVARRVAAAVELHLLQDHAQLRAHGPHGPAVLREVMGDLAAREIGVPHGRPPRASRSRSRPQARLRSSYRMSATRTPWGQCSWHL